MAHGNKNLIKLSKHGVIKYDSPEMDMLVHSLKNKLLPNASILLHSCKAGEGGKNFANTLAQFLPGHIIYGAEQVIRRGDLLLTGIYKHKTDGSLLPVYNIDDYNMFDFCYRKTKGKYKLYKFCYKNLNNKWIWQ